MSTIRPFDDRLDMWLEAGPVVAPDAVSDTVLAAFPVIRQRRPWLVLRGRPVAVPRRVKLALALVALLALVVAGAKVFLPPMPQVGPPDGSIQISSIRYDYRLEVPANWKVRLATVDLGTLETPWASSDAIDYFAERPGATLFPGVIVASVPIEATTTLDGWAASTTRVICGPTDAIETVGVDGERGLLHTYPECRDYFHLWTVVKHGDRAFHVIWINLPGSEVADRETYLGIVDSFEFTQ